MTSSDGKFGLICRLKKTVQRQQQLLRIRTMLCYVIWL